MISVRSFGATAMPVALTCALLVAGGADAGLPCGLTGNADQCQLPDQLGHGDGGTLAATSDPGAGDNGFFVAEDFSPLSSGDITEVCWWGIYFDFDAGTDCGPGGGNNFTITYYDNAGGVPGSVIAGPFNVFPTVSTTGLQVNGIDEYEYSATHAAVAVTAGDCYWIEIANNPGASGCTWLWSTAPPGDGRSAQDGEGDGFEEDDATDYDLAVCLNLDFATAACAPPVNDVCSSAINVSNGTYAFTNVNATTSADPEPLCNVNGENQVRADVWYRYLASCTGDVTIDLCDSDFNTRVAVYQDFCPVAAAQAIACNDDACGVQSQLTFAATAGHAYFFRIGGFMGAQGSGMMTISSDCLPPPSNNSCSSSQALSPGSTPFSTVGATTSGFEESCSGAAGTTLLQNEVWFRLLDQCDENVHVEITGADFNPIIVVYGPTCPTTSGTATACGPSVDFDGSVASFFRVAIGSADGSTGTGTVVVSCGPPASCAGDTNGDNDVDVNDLNNVILDWGTDGSGHGGDITDSSGTGPPDGIVNVNDLNAVIVNWGPC